MSVAFRRESDEEHLEPKFELPLPPGANLVTARGALLIGERATALEAAIADASAEAQLPLKRELRYWATRRATAMITPAPTDGSIGFGSRVTVVMNGAERVLAIVGGDEAEPTAGLIGFQAPLARALTGACAGDLIAFAGREIEVIEVDNGEE